MLIIRTKDVIKRVALLFALFLVGGISAVAVKAQAAHEFCDPSKVGATWTLNLAGKAKMRDVINGLETQVPVANIVPDYDVMDIDLEAISVTASWKSILNLIMEQNDLAAVCMEGGILRVARRNRLIASDEEHKHLLTSVLSQPRKGILVRVFVYAISSKTLSRLPAQFSPLVGTGSISGANFLALIDQAQSSHLVQVVARPFGSTLEQQAVEFRSEKADGFRMIRITPQLSNDASGRATNLTLAVLIETNQSLHTTVTTPNQEVVVLGGGSKSASGGLFRKQKTDALFCAISAERLP